MITAEEWKEIEKELQSIFGIVRLKCDEYKVTIALERMNQYKNALVVYVNGKIKREWLIGDKEYGEQRFFRKVTKRLFSEQKLTKRKVSKKVQKELLDKTYSYYDATWTSFRSLKKQLIDKNRNIEWIKGFSEIEEILKESEDGEEIPSAEYTEN